MFEIWCYFKSFPYLGKLPISNRKAAQRQKPLQVSPLHLSFRKGSSQLKVLINTWNTGNLQKLDRKKQNKQNNSIVVLWSPSKQVFLPGEIPQHQIRCLVFTCFLFYLAYKRNNERIMSHLLICGILTKKGDKQRTCGMVQENLEIQFFPVLCYSGKLETIQNQIISPLVRNKTVRTLKQRSS